MKLLYITNGINGSGGLERVLSIKASLLSEKQGFEIGILTLNRGHENPFYEFSTKIRFFSVKAEGNPLSYFLGYKKGIQKQIDAFQPDVVSVCDDGLKGFFLPKIIKTNAKWVYERHASMALNVKKGIKGNLIRRLMLSQIHRFDTFVVLTPSNIKEWNKENVVAIPNPLGFVSEERSTLTHKRAIAVGSHSHNKGYDLLIEAWQKVQAVHPDWSIHVFGKIDAAQRFVKLAEEKGLSQIHFHPPVQNIKEEYLQSSFLVLPSRSEGFGMVLTEAMECGLPCVSFDCPSGPGDIIQDGEDGFLVPPEDVDALTAKILLLIADEERRQKMGARAKENVKRYAAEEVVLQWVRLFTSLVR